MTATSPYAPTGRNSFLVHHPEVIQRRSSRIRRRNAFVVSFVVFAVKFRDSPFVQNMVHKMEQSEFGRQLQRRGTTVWKVIFKLGKSFHHQLWKGAGSFITGFRTPNRESRPLPTLNNGDDRTAHKDSTDVEEEGSRIPSPTWTNGDHHSTSPPSSADHIYQNRQRIRQVLMYWFGQYSPDTSQKKLWMIASSSVEHRRKIDADITAEFERTLHDLAATSRSGVWNEWVLDGNHVYGYEGKVAAIIVLDQFSRHMQRHYSETNSSSDPIPNQSELDTLAFQTAQQLTTHHEQEIQCGMIPLPMYIFGLMPYRHASTLESVQYVQQSIENLSCMEDQMNAMLQRFRKATNRRMAILQDESRRMGKDTTTATTTVGDIVQAGHENSRKDDHHEEDDSGYVTASSTIVTDETPDKHWTDDDILEVFPFDADMTSAMKHPVHVTIRSFLASQGIHPVTAATNDSQHAKGAKKKTKKKLSKPKNSSQTYSSQSQTTTTNTTTSTIASTTTKKYPVIVSLSGGVDSMVIAAVLAHLVKECDYNLHLVAIHLDYANRPEAGAEADYVGQFCHKHGIDFKCRRIDEVTRGITARDDYERMTRDIRYTTYRQTVQECIDEFQKNVPSEDSSSSTTPSPDVVVGVMLGHHRGDLRENVLSNSHKGCGPLDLSGMTSISMNDGVLIYRPLLPLEKDKVLDYSHKFGVPYFKDTTPHWSTRGKLRNQLLPLLQDIYGEGSMNNLSTLATESDEAKELLHQTVLGPFLEQVQFQRMGISFDTAGWKHQGLFFWKFVLREALHNAGLGMFSDKSVMSFLERIQATNIREGWLQCRRDYAVYLGLHGRVYVFYPESFPFRKADQFTCAGQAVAFGEDHAVRIGPWKIMSEVMDSSQIPNEDTAQSLLGEKAIGSMDTFMDGHVQYYMKVPMSGHEEEEEKSESPSSSLSHDYRPLVFVSEYTKSSRPVAWRKLDLRIQTILPLLGNDLEAVRLLEETNGGRVYGDDYGIVKVTMINERHAKHEKKSPGVS